MSKKRTKIGKFIHSTWNNMNIRCGKYKHLQTKNKCKVYEGIEIKFSRQEFKSWCYENKDFILSLNRPSIDRKNPNENYSLDNIQVIELVDNIKRKRIGNGYINGPKSNTIRGVRLRKGRWLARITFNSKEIHIGSFNTKIEALNAFYERYLSIHKIPPWESDE